MKPLELLNFVFMVVAFLCVMAMIDHVDRNTRNSMRLAVVLLGVGTIAEAAGTVRHWEVWTDTLFFGGVLTLLLANLRTPRIAEEGKPARYPFLPAWLSAWLQRARIMASDPVVTERASLMVGTATALAVAAAWVLGG